VYSLSNILLVCIGLCDIFNKYFVYSAHWYLLILQNIWNKITQFFYQIFYRLTLILKFIVYLIETGLQYI